MTTILKNTAEIMQTLSFAAPEVKSNLTTLFWDQLISKMINFPQVNRMD